MSKKKAVLFIVLALVVGLALGVGGTLGVLHSSQTGTMNYVPTSGTCGDNLTWKLDKDTHVLTISGTGDMYNYKPATTVFNFIQTSSAYAPWMGVMYYNDYSENLTIVIEDGVTSIGENAFYLDSTGNALEVAYTSIDAIKAEMAIVYNLHIASLTIPDSVTSIGAGAFEKCDLQGADINIPTGVTSIGAGAFTDTSFSGTVNIPAGVTSFNANALDGCNVTAYNVDSGNTVYSSDNGVLLSKDQTTIIRCPSGYSGAYSIPDSVRTIGSYAFYGCTGVTGVTSDVLFGGSNLTEIGDYAFAGCTGITAVTLPRTVTTIGAHSYENCGMQTLYFILANLETVGDGAFNGCANLSEVTVVGTEEDYDTWGFDFGSAAVTVRDGWV